MSFPGFENSRSQRHSLFCVTAICSFARIHFSALLRTGDSVVQTCNHLARQLLISSLLRQYVFIHKNIIQQISYVPIKTLSFDRMETYHRSHGFIIRQGKEKQFGFRTTPFFSPSLLKIFNCTLRVKRLVAFNRLSGKKKSYYFLSTKE